MLSLKKLIQLPTRKAMGPNCHGLWIYYIFLLTIWLPSVLLPLRQNVIFNQFQQIPYALRLENKWYFNITHYRGASSSPDLLSCSVCGVLVFIWLAFFSDCLQPSSLVLYLWALAQLLRVRDAERLRSPCQDLWDHLTTINSRALPTAWTESLCPTQTRVRTRKICINQSIPGLLTLDSGGSLHSLKI